MSKNIIRTAAVTALAGAGLALGAGLASADTGAAVLPVADGAYTLSVYSPLPGPGLFPAAIGSVPATVADGRLVVAGVPVQGAQLEGYDVDGDGRSDGIAVMIGDNNVGYLK